MSGYVDLHAHYLPGVDDGAPDLDTALSMVRATRELGFHELYATPHQRSGLYLPDLSAVNAAWSMLHDALAGDDAPRLGLGAENYWDEVLHQRIQTDQIPSYDGGPAFLFEVSNGMMPPGIERTLFDLRVRGRLPVMAHPERYASIQQQPRRAEALGRTAALLIDLAALQGAHGPAEMRTARRLLQDGLVHAAATDIHRPEDAEPIGAGMAWIRKQFGPTALDRLLIENPHRILSGELPDPLT
jgi:protein-tyrosine phosphatase